MGLLGQAIESIKKRKKEYDQMMEKIGEVTEKPKAEAKEPPKKKVLPQREGPKVNEVPTGKLEKQKPMSVNEMNTEIDKLKKDLERRKKAREEMLKKKTPSPGFTSAGYTPKKKKEKK